MKMPAPPPPPPMAPGAPPPPVFKMPKSNPNDRDALLKSIRKGAKLKKTVTNDRSAPAVAGGVKNSSVKNNNNNNDGVISSSPSPMRNFSNIQLELKKQLANHDNRSRGPPPPAPSRNVSIFGGFVFLETGNDYWLLTDAALRCVITLELVEEQTIMTMPLPFLNQVIGAKLMIKI
nr:unnamed protein product [Callosobruchus chinensis]